MASARQALSESRILHSYSLSVHSDVVQAKYVHNLEIQARN